MPAACEEIRNLVPEVALGIAPGEERARVLAHIRTCADCRRLLEGLAETADGLLLLAPSHEPPSGFESKVLTGMNDIAPVHRSRRYLGAAAVVAAAAIAAGGVLWSTADERSVAAHYREALEVANGEYFGVVELMSGDGDRVGHLFAYQGSPSWVFLVFTDPLPSGDYQAEIEQRSGELTAIGSLEVSAGKVTWGSDLPVELRAVHAVRILDDRGIVAVEGAFRDR
jgi:hypothetical protein